MTTAQLERSAFSEEAYLQIAAQTNALRVANGLPALRAETGNEQFMTDVTGLVRDATEFLGRHAKQGAYELLDTTADFTANHGKHIATGLVAATAFFTMEASTAGATNPPAAVVAPPSHPAVMPSHTDVWTQGRIQGFTVQEFAEDNPGVNPANVYGTRVYQFPNTPENTAAAAPAAPVAAAVAPPTPAALPASHPGTFPDGENVWTEGQKQGFSVAQWAADNPGKNPDLVYPTVVYQFPNTPENTTAAVGTITTPTVGATAPAGNSTAGVVKIVAKPGYSDDFVADRAAPVVGVSISTEQTVVQNANTALGIVHIDDEITVPDASPEQGTAIAAAVAAGPQPDETPAAAVSPAAIQQPAPSPVPPPTTGETNGSVALSPQQLSASQAAEIVNTSANNSPQPYLEQEVIGTLALVAQHLGIPVSDVLTPEKVIFFTAWTWVEKGDLDNKDTFNIFNEGIDDQSLLATAFSADGLEAFKSLWAGEQGNLETFETPYQNRLLQVLANPNATAADCVAALTWFQNYAGNKPWAGMDDPAEGYSQQAYQNTLNEMVANVRANYATMATVVLGGTYDMYKPRVSSSLLQFTGTGVAATPQLAAASQQ